MREFLRRCPVCGRRFVVRLKNKKVVDAEHGTERVVHQVAVAGLARGYSRVFPAGVTYEDVPVERDKIDVTYECNHCHHKWTETVIMTTSQQTKPEP